MSDLTDEVCRLIDGASEEERLLILNYLNARVPPHPLETKWGTTSEVILSAIARSADLTLRGIRGILAEAMFEKTALPALIENGWQAAAILGEQSYDFLIEKDAAHVRIQVKLQRSELGAPMEYSARKRAKLNCANEMMYVVEAQKTRSGERKGKKTRPYEFGDFDILAVNLHPSTGDWKRFHYTIGTWLLPRPSDATLIEIMQPVPDQPDEYWTDNLSQCLEWFLSGTVRRIYFAQ